MLVSFARPTSARRMYRWDGLFLWTFTTDCLRCPNGVKSLGQVGDSGHTRSAKDRNCVRFYSSWGSHSGVWYWGNRLTSRGSSNTQDLHFGGDAIHYNNQHLSTSYLWDQQMSRSLKIIHFRDWILSWQLLTTYGILFLSIDFGKYYLSVLSVLFDLWQTLRKKNKGYSISVAAIYQTTFKLVSILLLLTFLSILSHSAEHKCTIVPLSMQCGVF